MENRKDYWLAEAKRIDTHGTVWEVKLCDGPHEKPEGVVTANRLYGAIDVLKGNEKYVMVTVEQVPKLKTKINKAAVNTLNKAFKDINK